MEYTWYTGCMHNWSTDAHTLIQDKEKYAIWKLEQMINFGLEDEKLNEQELKKYWQKLTIDPARRKLLELFLK